MDRRGFLSGMIALGMTPAIVRADSLVRIIPKETTIVDTIIADDLTELEILKDSQAARMLWPGVKAWFDLAYKDDFTAIALGRAIRHTKEKTAIEVLSINLCDKDFNALR